MDAGEILRLVETIHRDKQIDREIVFEGIEAALLSAARKKYGNRDSIQVVVDRKTGQVTAWDDEMPDGQKILDPTDLGRIAAQTAKQIIIQKVREAERDVIYDDYEHKVGEMVTGTVQRFEGRNMIVNMGRAEGFMPWREQIPGETFHPGERVRAIIVDVKTAGQRVKIILSRTREDLVAKLFELEVPEVAEGSVVIRAIEREAGFRTKVAVQSVDARVDCVGACVGVRGSRIKNVVDEFNGERIDIVRWNDSVEVLIINALRPAEISSITLDYDQRKARVVVPEEQLNLAIGRRGQNVRLASKLVGWDIDIVTEEEQIGRENLLAGYLERIEDLPPELVHEIVESGYNSPHDIVEHGLEYLMEIPGMEEETGQRILTAIAEMLENPPEELVEAEAAIAEHERDVNTPSVVKPEDLPGAETEEEEPEPEPVEDPSVVPPRADAGQERSAAPLKEGGTPFQPPKVDPWSPHDEAEAQAAPLQKS